MLGGNRTKALLKLLSLQEEECTSVNSSFVKLPMSLKYHFPYLCLPDLRRKLAPLFSLPLPSPYVTSTWQTVLQREMGTGRMCLCEGCASLEFNSLVTSEPRSVGTVQEDIHLRELCLCFPDQLRERKDLCFFGVVFFSQGSWLEYFLSNDDLKAHGVWLYD